MFQNLRDLRFTLSPQGRLSLLLVFDVTTIARRKQSEDRRDAL
jgi:hypothetical protein